MFVTGSQDKTARIWDTRTSASIDVIPSSNPGTPQMLLNVKVAAQLQQYSTSVHRTSWIYVSLTSHVYR